MNEKVCYTVYKSIVWIFFTKSPLKLCTFFSLGVKRKTPCPKAPKGLAVKGQKEIENIFFLRK